MEQTLIEYAAERMDDPWWDEVYQIIHRVLEKMKSSPEQPKVAKAAVPLSIAMPSKMTEQVKAKRLTRVMCECAVCTKRFPAQRSDAKYCSTKCQKRGNRRGLAFRGRNVNINAFCEA